MLHLVKLAVGIGDVAQLRAVQAERARANPPLRHLTRNQPRRAAEILDGGSIYWAINRAICVRQRILAITASSREDGTPCAALMLDPELVPLSVRPIKPFQGWRYLLPDDAPPDYLRPEAISATELPAALRLELRALCLI